MSKRSQPKMTNEKAANAGNELAALIARAVVSGERARRHQALHVATMEPLVAQATIIGLADLLHFALHTAAKLEDPRHMPDERRAPAALLEGMLDEAVNGTWRLMREVQEQAGQPAKA